MRPTSPLAPCSLGPRCVSRELSTAQVSRYFDVHEGSYDQQMGCAGPRPGRLRAAPSCHQLLQAALPREPMIGR